MLEISQKPIEIASGGEDKKRQKLFDSNFHFQQIDC